MKRKKRFGRSILEHAPAGFIKGLKEKITRQGGYVMTLNTRKYCASQKEHVTGKKVKHKLSDRTKFINKKLVQRDCYSAFLIYHALDEENIDYEACKKDFRNYLKRQKLLVNEMIIRGDKTGNFGLKDFQEIA